MKFSCIFFLALALFGAVSQAYIATGYNAVGPVGAVGPIGAVGPVGAIGAVGPVGYNRIYENGCGAPYAAGYETGYGCRTACVSTPAVCDACNCVKTVVRPNIVERIPYSCARRVQTSTCRSSCGVYSGAGYGVGAVGGGCGGYGNGGYIY